MDNLYQICKEINFIPKKLLEVGACHVDVLQLKEFVSNGYECILVEANPRLFYCLKYGFNDVGTENNFINTWPNIPSPPYKYKGLEGQKNVTLYNCAIGDNSGNYSIFEANSSTFVGGINSPAKCNDGYKENKINEYIVEFKTIDMIDSGDIEILAADCEGSEWFCLKTLISRPKLICLETHGNKYTNPFLENINKWMSDNKYIVYRRDITDTLWIKE